MSALCRCVLVCLCFCVLVYVGESYGLCVQHVCETMM